MSDVFSDDDLEELNDFRALVRSPGWTRLVELCNEGEFAMKQRVLFEPTVGNSDAHPLSQVINREYDKGFASGIARAVQLPSERIVSLEEALELAKEKETENA